MQAAGDPIATERPGAAEHGEFVAFSPRGFGFRLSPRRKQGAIVYTNRSLYLGVYWFLIGSVLLGIGGFVWATKTPTDPWGFIVLFGAMGFFVFSAGFVMAARYQRVEFDPDGGRCRWVTRFDLKARRGESPMDEVRIVRCRIRAAEGRFPKRHGVVAILGDDCLPLASMGSAEAREKYLDEIPEQLSPYIQDGEATVSLVIRVL